MSSILTEKTTYEDIPHELRANIFQLRTQLRKLYLKEKAIILFRNIKKFVLIKRAFELCYELYNRELVACDRHGGYNDNDEEVIFGGVKVYQRKNEVTWCSAYWYFNLENTFTCKFDKFYERFVHSRSFSQFANRCHASFITDSRNLKFDIAMILMYHEPMGGFSVSKVTLDDFKPFGNLPLDSEPDSDSHSDSDSEPYSDSDSDSEPYSGYESHSESHSL